MLHEFFFPKIEEGDMNDIWFQEDGATYHFENQIISRNSNVNFIGRLGAVIWPGWTIFCGEPLRINVTLTIQRRLRLWNTKSKLPFMGLKPKQSRMYWKIGLIEWGTVRPAVAANWMMCFILKWKGSIFLIKPYFWKNIDKFFFYCRFKFQTLYGPPCIQTALLERF